MKKQHNNTRLICQLSAVAALVLSANAMAETRSAPIPNG